MVTKLPSEERVRREAPLAEQFIARTLSRGQRLLRRPMGSVLSLRGHHLLRHPKGGSTAYFAVGGPELFKR